MLAYHCRPSVTCKFLMLHRILHNIECFRYAAAALISCSRGVVCMTLLLLLANTIISSFIAPPKKLQTAKMTLTFNCCSSWWVVISSAILVYQSMLVLVFTQHCPHRTHITVLIARTAGSTPLRGDVGPNSGCFRLHKS